jgi:superfamily II RNA helicase
VSVSPSIAAVDPGSLFPFTLDDFQLDAIAALNEGRSVVVCAPTGSGKTLIGEYAIYRALASNKRVFYTTPLKALSNQKLRDFRDQFGTESVGLLTGDMSVNRDAPILVMTTEIFRNMLYGTPIGQVGTSLVGVDTVVLDECHYMNDRQRGTVWEESIIYCPSSIQLVALSATVANSDQLTDWIDQVHGPTDLIYSDFRPVPLEYYFCNPKGLFPLLDSSKQHINPRLKPKGAKRDPKQQRRREEIPPIAFVVSQLQQRDMLPAIYFIFSRRGCDQAVQEVQDLDLVNPSEARQIRDRLIAFVQRNPELSQSRQLASLERGIAVHHAGILPAWKALVEELFQSGLIKVVFATETLAAGINMPARTTVISSLSKRTDAGHRLLNPSEFLQMAGRAGRRGMDTLGHVVTLQTRFEGTREAVYLATTGADPLVSQFAPSYGMVLNLLQTHTLEEARELVERSFGQYLSTLYLKPQQAAIADLKTQLQGLEQQCGAVDWDTLRQYEKLRERLKEEQRLLKILQNQHQEFHASDLAMALAFAVSGTILSLKGEHVPVAEPLPAVLVSKAPSSGQSPYLVCIGQDKRWHVVTVHDVVGLHAEYPRIAAVDTLQPPAELSIKPGHNRQGLEPVAEIAAQIPPLPSISMAPEVEDQLEIVEQIQAQIQAHPAYQQHNSAKLLKAERQIQGIVAEIRDREAKLSHQSERYWDEFLALIEILQEFNCLDGITPTDAGQAVAAFRGDNELWLGLALLSGELDHLEPHEFAAACAALVTEVSRPDTWSNYEVSRDVQEALGGLRNTRRQVFQVQRRYQVALPVWLELDLVGLVEQWAMGVEWPVICANTSLDEGDLVRILRRTLDFMSQIPHVKELSAEVHQTARDAMQLIDRFPINENIEE